MSLPSKLTLTVAGQAAAQFGARAQMAFAQRGGSIGRADDSDWVLAAPGVSRTHAVVRYLNGMYFIEDRSTNGMLLNGAALQRGDPAALGDGDRLQLDSFEIQVQLQAEAPAAPPPPAVTVPDDTSDLTQVVPAALPPHVASSAPSAGIGAFDFDFGLPGFGGAAAPAGGAYDDALLGDLGVPGAAGELDPLRLLDPLPAPPVPPQPTQSWNHSDAGHDHFRVPAPPAAAAARGFELPENWDLTTGDFAPAAPPAASAAATPAAPQPFAAQAAPSAPSAQMPEDVARIFEIVVDGVMEVLRARAEIKNTFRLPVTVIQRSENNPLKFAATPEDALQKLLAPPSPAFLSGVAAFDDAFDDIRCHQMAMLAGMRAAFESMLFHFSPDRLEQEVDASGKRLAFAGKGRYWERYRDNFQALAKDPDECFRRLFGDEFARAYEAQLARLKSARRAGKSPL
ncbi:type VI secretion system-associated FHA domain protein TagH [Xanthomonas sp. SI]|nr:type VI secretion system-associated FHA domain protein TagH [Xanthomonas sp. SI]QNH14711.1 type VI secretion system-associated FHA domain protein TagH [Xanthomonas sp. SI]